MLIGDGFNKENNINYVNGVEVVSSGRTYCLTQDSYIPVDPHQFFSKKRKVESHFPDFVSFKIRKIEKEESSEESSSIEVQKDEGNEENSPLEVNVYSVGKLFKKLDKLTSLPSKEKFNQILSLSTLSQKVLENEPDSWSFWLECSSEQKTTWMHLIIDQREYDSQCFSEADLCGFTQLELGNSYYYINACYEEDPNHYYFQIRLDKNITCAEIIHIEKGVNISGNEVKSICMKILDYLNPERIYLKDDSKIFNRKHQTNLALRVTLPIANEIPQTWYREFRPISFAEPLSIDNQEHIPQDEETYSHSVEVVRNQKILNITDGPEKIGLLKKWTKKYLAEMQLEDITVHQLAQAVYKAARGVDIRFANQRKRIVANNDFAEFYSTYLLSVSILSNCDAYVQALTIIHGYQIWVKTNY